jgi:RNA polymerase sigma factor (sigma-70 family)
LELDSAEPKDDVAAASEAVAASKPPRTPPGLDEAEGEPPDGAEPQAPAASSFEDVYRADYARMVRAAHLITGSNETAEEVVQDAFVALYPRFAGLEDPSGYLYRSVVNGALSLHRRNRVARRLRHLTTPATVTAPEIDETWIALKRLPPRRRAVVVLRFYADFPLAEIANVLGCEEGTVKSMLNRGLAQLKDVICR